MAKTEPKPSTRNARIAESDAGTAARQTKMSTPGTGQHVRDSARPVKGASITRDDDRPTKGGSFPGNDSDGRSTKAQQQSKDLSQRVTTAPSVDMPAFQMQRDSGPKTAREREFGSWMSSAKDALDGAHERDYFPSTLERGTNAEIAKGDQFTGSANTVTKPNKRGQ